MQKTIAVKVERRLRHPRFGKTIRRASTVLAHDEEEKARIGDEVELMESRPLSKRKSWRLVRIIKPAAMPEATAENASASASAAETAREQEET
jgi:small subunit ribosomal protein S17